MDPEDGEEEESDPYVVLLVKRCFLQVPVLA
jgi:hypothetical protein